ncbi:hypothetical protein O1R50_11585 [Glycomyces luteolus]|uniref:Uncharacterized protein n=1 Tax=Glycomyces luteolus TaxID=2670330 RepID=A0A9X3SRS9_9ACTN|nr:hypothetical protein [Glycomyces luteolus]MDA1360269.1 hypothetical protein [Glycomyces luteolus]
MNGLHLAFNGDSGGFEIVVGVLQTLEIRARLDNHGDHDLAECDGLMDGPPCVANAMRGLMLGPDALPHGHTVTGDVLWTLGWSLGLIILFAPLAARAYKRA